jgi:putative transposase
MMMDLGRRYVRYFNDTHGRSGTLWEGRFKSSLVDTARYCLACYRYIELNPVRAGMVTDPGQYSWSSYRANALGFPNSLIAPHSEWLELGPNDSIRCNAYRAMFDDNPPKSEVKAIRRALRKGLPLGGTAFRRRVENDLGIKLSSGRRGRPDK